jgi:hypothetical protein
MGELEKVARPANRANDAILSLAASHSPEEISVALGNTVSPATIAAHTQTLLKSKNWLTAIQEDRLITIRLNNLLADLERRAWDIDNVKVRLSILKEIGNRLDKRTAATDEDLNKLYGNQGRIMGQAFDLALSYMKGALREAVDPEQWEMLKSEGLRNAQLELSRYQAEDE